jgi:hypothetical protein
MLIETALHVYNFLINMEDDSDFSDENNLFENIDEDKPLGIRWR